MNRILVDKLGLVPPYNDFMAFRELFISAGQDGIFETHMLTISKLSKVLKVNMCLNLFGFDVIVFVKNYWISENFFIKLYSINIRIVESFYIVNYGLSTIMSRSLSKNS